MKVDARPFLRLVTPGGFAKCGRPEFNPQTVGFGRGGQTGVVQDTATHKVTVYNPLPPDLNENVRVTIDDVEYIVLRGGVDPQRYGAVLYLRRDSTAQELP